MPLYEYECRACHHRFEALVRGSSPPSCPACQAEDLERILSLFAVNSDSTRRAALSDGRKHQKKANRDKAIADHEAAHHSHDH
jgi:putative FmdB family regulatory protein